MNPNRTSTTVPTEGWFRCLRPHALSPVLVSHERGPFMEWTISEGIPSYQVPLPFPNKLNPFPFAWSILQLARIVRRHDIQIIHCNEQDIYPIGSYLARLFRLPVVVSVHFTMEAGYCRWAFSGKRAPDRIFFISEGNLAACSPAVEGVIPRTDWRILPNGLDLDKFKPDPLLREAFRRENGLKAQVALGVACALRPRKQLEHFFQAASRIVNPQVKVVLAGGPRPEDQYYAEELVGAARRLLGDRFIHVGKLRDLRAFYNGLDLFINTSQEEACSISVLESLASGCPVVGYPSKSVDGQILPNGGEIVPQDDLRALSAALEKWTNSQELLDRGRIGARQRAEAAFDILKLSQQLHNEYQELLHHRS